jgi:cyclophilin family peptidyl-prolyl cis-trans isomerase
MKNLLYLIMIFALFVGCKNTNSSNKEPESTSTSNQKGNTVNNEMQLSPDSILVAVIKTNMGTVQIQLFPDLAPKTVENFTGLAKKGYYNGLIFHRIIENFMIQGGDPTGTGMGGESVWGGKFDDEINPSLNFDQPGMLAMANAGPNTNGSQFFITVAPTKWLNGHYSIFGKVINGMDVVLEISKVKTTKPGDRPVNKVVMETVTIEKQPKPEQQK